MNNRQPKCARQKQRTHRVDGDDPRRCALQADAEVLQAGCESEIDSMRMLQLVRDSECSAYDCEFISLAENLDVKLVAMNKKPFKASPDRTVALNAI